MSKNAVAGHYWRITALEVKRIVVYLKAGMSRSRVAKIFQRDSRLIDQIAEEHGIPRKRGVDR